MERERLHTIAAASRLELEALVGLIEGADIDYLESWLANPEGVPAASREAYQKFSCLLIAYDSAHAQLLRLAESADG